MTRELHALQAMAMRAGAASSDRVLLVSTSVVEGTLSFPGFDEPVQVVRSPGDGHARDRAIVAQSDGRLFDVVLLDGDTARTPAPVRLALRALRPDGLVVLIDRSRSLARALADAPWGLGLTGRPAPLPRTVERALIDHGLTRMSGWYVEPAVPRLRALVEPAFRSAVPGLPATGGLRRAVRACAFYLQPRHMVVVARSPERPALIDNAMQRLQCPAPPGDDQVRQCLLSGTNLLMIKVAGPAGVNLFLRFPLEPQSERRAAHHHEMLQHLQHRGFALAPAPIGAGRAGGFPFFAEAAMPGTSLSRTLPAIAASALVRHFDAALDALGALHALDGGDRVLDEELFERHIGVRIVALRRCLLEHGEDDSACPAIADLLRQACLGTRVRLGVCHGDAKLANCLFQGSTVTGMIDWDMSEREGLCHLDVAALLMHTILHRTGCSIRDLVQGVPDSARPVLARCAAFHARTGTTAWDVRATAVLYWLDRVFRHQTFDRVHDEWFARVVRPVANDLRSVHVRRPAGDAGVDAL